jgi:hypothetical protein
MINFLRFLSRNNWSLIFVIVSTCLPLLTIERETCLFMKRTNCSRFGWNRGYLSANKKIVIEHSFLFLHVKCKYSVKYAPYQDRLVELLKVKHKVVYCTMYLEHTDSDSYLVMIGTGCRYNSNYHLVLRYVIFVLSVRVMVFSATFTNISVISWWSIVLVVETRETHRPAKNKWQTLSQNVVSSKSRMNFENIHIILNSPIVICLHVHTLSLYHQHTK